MQVGSGQSQTRRLVAVPITAPTLSEARMLAHAQYGADKVLGVY
ncbi:MAG: hypothetical protein N2235_08425 [Fischerella sp.]|nr:hypothetical protein [Fischerella sp.]